MINLNLVTGHRNTPHVTAAEQAAFNAQTIGSGEYVLNIGNRFAVTLISNSEVQVASGDLYMQGRFVRLSHGTTADLTFDNGIAGQRRKDLIVATYSKDTQTGIESAALQVIKGTPTTTGTPTAPEIVTGDIINGTATRHDMKLYEVQFNGINLVSIRQLFEIANPLSEKVDKEPGKGLSSENFTTEEKNKLSGIAQGANNYIHPQNAGNKHIPSGGSQGKFLTRGATDGTGEWCTVGDYIVSQKVYAEFTKTYTYRKWNSGFAELFCVDNQTISSWEGNYGYQALPNSVQIFISKPAVISTNIYADRNSTPGSYDPISEVKYTVVPFSPTQYFDSTYLFNGEDVPTGFSKSTTRTFHMIGRWK